MNDEPAEGNVDPANVDRSFLSPFLTQTNHRPNVPAAVMLVPFQDVKQGTIKRHVAILFNTLDRFNEGESPKTVPITELMTQRVKTSLELHYSHSASLISAGHEGQCSQVVRGGNEETVKNREQHDDATWSETVNGKQLVTL